MRKKLDPRLALGRVRHPLTGTIGDEHNGAFTVKAPSGRRLNILISDGLGWDHVSVSLAGNLATAPSWAEMCWVKELIFEPQECVVQYHPPQSSYVNVHPGCLHLWRPQTGRLLMPPVSLV